MSTDTLDRIPAVRLPRRLDDQTKEIRLVEGRPYRGRHRRPDPTVDEFDGTPTTTLPSPVWLAGTRLLGKLADLARGGR
jgi:hypothetical protein